MDEREFCQRVEASRDRLFRIAYAIVRDEQDCADAMQEALLRAWANVGGLREARYFETWLVRILINECRMLRRRNRRVTPVEVLPEREAPPPDEALRDALEALDERWRLPLVLHYLEGFRVEEVAKLLGIPSGTVKWRLSRARAALRAEWMEDEGEVREHAAR